MKDVNQDLFGKPLRPIMLDPDQCVHCGKSKNDHQLNPQNYRMVDSNDAAQMDENAKITVVCNQFTSGTWTTKCWCGKNDTLCDGNCLPGNHDEED